MDDGLLQRFALQKVLVALEDTPVVLVNGPRQSGKTTLVRRFVPGERHYLTLDDETVLIAAQGDPAGLVRGLERATLDEVQRVPALLRAIKKKVDEDRRAGHFLLTGSANVLMLPTVAESLAGRMEVVTLLPLSRAEIIRCRPRFLHMIFQGRIPSMAERLIGDDLVAVVLQGGYPEMLRRTDEKRQRAWVREYVSAVVQRDVRDIAEVEKLARMPRLLAALAHGAGQLTNYARLAGELGLDNKTAQRYVGLLEHLFLVQRLAPWHRNRLSRLIKTPKLHFLDSGLLAALQGINVAAIRRDRTPLGPLLETFVFAEVLKAMSWEEEGYHVSHYRDKDQMEVDLVIENELGAVVGIEVKAAATVTGADFKGLKRLSAATGGDFRLGVVLYDGDSIVPFGPRLFAAPVACLWGGEGEGAGEHMRGVWDRTK